MLGDEFLRQPELRRSSLGRPIVLGSITRWGFKLDHPARSSPIDTDQLPDHSTVDWHSKFRFGLGMPGLICAACKSYGTPNKRKRGRVRLDRLYRFVGHAFCASLNDNSERWRTMKRSALW